MPKTQLRRKGGRSSEESSDSPPPSATSRDAQRARAHASYIRHREKRLDAQARYRFIHRTGRRKISKFDRQEAIAFRKGVLEDMANNQRYHVSYGVDLNDESDPYEGHDGLKEHETDLLQEHVAARRRALTKFGGITRLRKKLEREEEHALGHLQELMEERQELRNGDADDDLNARIYRTRRAVAHFGQVAQLESHGQFIDIDLFSAAYDRKELLYQGRMLNEAHVDDAVSWYEHEEEQRAESAM